MSKSKKGPPTLKGLLQKGRQRYGEAGNDAFDFLEEREKLLREAEEVRQQNLDTSYGARTSPPAPENAPPTPDIHKFKVEHSRWPDQIVPSTDNSSVPSTKTSRHKQKNEQLAENNQYESQPTVPSTNIRSVLGTNNGPQLGTTNESVPSTLESSGSLSSHMKIQKYRDVNANIDSFLLGTDRPTVPSTNNSAQLGTANRDVPSTHEPNSDSASDRVNTIQRAPSRPTVPSTENSIVLGTVKRETTKLGTDASVPSTQSHVHPVQIPSTESGSVLGTEITQIARLRGLSKDLFLYIALEAIKVPERSVTLKTSELRDRFSQSLNSLRISLRRLKAEYGLLSFEAESKGGAEAKRKYFISESVASAVVNYMTGMRSETQSNWVQKSSVYPVQIPSTEPSSKLVSNINNNLLTRKEDGRPEFSTIDISGLNRFGITEKQLRDFENQKLSIPVEQLEDFVWKFEQYASDANNIKGVRNVVGLFCKMAQSLASGVDPLSHIKTPEEMALENALAASRRALGEQGRVEDELKQSRFLEWFNALTQNTRDKIEPPTALIASGSELQKKKLFGYFDQQVWPQLKNDIFNASL